MKTTWTRLVRPLAAGLLTFVAAALGFAPHGESWREMKWTLSGAPVAEAATEEVNVDGVLHVRNGTQPTGGVESLRLEELWRVGGEDDDVIFGLIPRAAADAEGNVYVLDSQLCQVSVYSPDGELVRTLFREGEGPGEVRQPRDMFLLGDGRVALIQEFPGTVSMVDNNGNPAGRVTVGGQEGGIFSLTACDGAGEIILVSGTEMGQSTTPGIQPRTNFLSSISLNGLESVRYADLYTEYNFEDFHFKELEHMPSFWWCFAAAPDGRMYVVPSRENYEIHAFHPDGTLDRIIECDFKPQARDPEEAAFTKSLVESALSNLPFEFRITVEETAAAVAYLQRGLRVRPDGSLWVLSGEGIRDLPEGVLARFDVFEPTGEFTKQIQLRGPGSGRDDGIFFVGDDRCVVINGYIESLAAQFGDGTTYSEEEESDPVEVICYRMVK